MAKIICRNSIEMKARDFNTLLSDRLKLFICEDDCPICHGKGYTEAEVVDADVIRKKIQDEIGTDRSAVLVLGELLKEAK